MFVVTSVAIFLLENCYRGALSSRERRGNFSYSQWRCSLCTCEVPREECSSTLSTSWQVVFLHRWKDVLLINLHHYRPCSSKMINKISSRLVLMLITYGPIVVPSYSHRYSRPHTLCSTAVSDVTITHLESDRHNESTSCFD